MILDGRYQGKMVICRVSHPSHAGLPDFSVDIFRWFFSMVLRERGFVD
jgi:hypothetical protein